MIAPCHLTTDRQTAQSRAERSGSEEAQASKQTMTHRLAGERISVRDSASRGRIRREEGGEGIRRQSGYLIMDN
jgi:hypothetical protein